MTLNHSPETHKNLIARIPSVTGRALPEWFASLESGPAFLRCEERAHWLADEHGLTHGYASAIVHEYELRRRPQASLCVFTDNFFGEWVQVEGDVEIIPLPEAMDLLVDYYRRVSGEHPDWDDYRAAMVRDQRVIVRITVTRAGPDVSG